MSSFDAFRVLLKAFYQTISINVTEIESELIGTIFCERITAAVRS